MAHVVGIDLGTTNSLVAQMRGDRPEIIANEARQAADAVDRRARQARQDPRRRHGARISSSPCPSAPSPRSSGSWARRQKVKLGAREYTPQEVSRVHPEAAQGRRRAQPRRSGRRSGHHRARLLHGRAAAGDQGRGRAGRLQGRSHLERADRGGARLRARSPGQRAVRPRLRSRRRHLRRQRARDVRGRARRQGVGGQQPPRRRRLRSRASPIGWRASSRPRTASTCARTSRRWCASSRRPSRPRWNCRR